MKYNYKTQGVCSQQITFDIEDGVLSGVEFFGGCNGNLKAISTLLEGTSAQEAVNKLKGNTCGFKNTSCADQLARAIEKALDQK